MEPPEEFDKNTKIYHHDIKIIKRFFPYQENIDMEKLMISDIGKYSISKPYEADNISNIIINIMVKKNMNPNNLCITDATAGFGGNLINFSKRFKKVIGIEKSTINYNIMKNNIEVYGLENIEIYNNSFIKIIPELCGNVVFIDPPWGGRKYRYKTNIMLHLDKVYIYDIVNQIPNSTKLIAIKIPYNFDYSSFITKIYPNQSISHWSINNYNLITIVRE